MRTEQQRKAERERKRRERAAHPERAREAARRYRARHPDRAREQQQRYRAACPKEVRERTNACSRRWAVANPDRVRDAWRRHRLQCEFGLDLEHYTHKLAQQGGVCEICGDPPKLDGILEVDHCHTTGLIRGLLCHRCNSTVGAYERSSHPLRSTHPLYTQVAVYVDEYRRIAGAI